MFLVGKQLASNRLGKALSIVGARSADVSQPDVVGGLDVFAISPVLVVEPEAVLGDVFLLGTLKSLLAVGVDVVNLYASGFVGVVAFVPNMPLGVEEDVPNPEKPNALCEGPLCVDGAAVPKIELVVVEDDGSAVVPKIEPVVVEDDGCTAVPNIEPVVVEDDGCTAVLNMEPHEIEDKGCTGVPKIESVVVEDKGCTAVPKIEPVVVEDEGCTSAVERVSGVWLSRGEGIVPNCLPVVAEDKDSSVPNG